MKKMIAVALSVVLLTSSAFIVLSNQADADYEYQFTYGDYTLTQTGCVVDETNSTATVSYSIVGADYSGSYSIQYTYADGKYTFVASKVTGTNPKIVMVPPVVKVNGADLTIGEVGASANEGSIGSIEQLYIISEGADITFPQAAFQYAIHLSKLVVKGNQITVAGNRILKDCPAIREVYMDGLFNMTSSTLITGLDTTERVTFSVKLYVGSTIQQIAKTTVGGITLKLLPGSSKSNGSINFTGVDEVLVCEDDWPEGVTVNDLSEASSYVAVGLSPMRYSSGSAQPSFSIAIPQGQSGVAVDKSTATENETVTITLSPEQGKQVASVSVLKDNNDPVQVTVNPQNANQYTFTMPASNVTVSATFEDIPPVAYGVVIDQNLTGVAVDKSTATENETVTITLSPEQGKQVASVSVLKDNNDPVQVTVNPQNANQYTFTMPASNVTVSATFEDIPSVSITPAISTVAKGSSTNVTVSAVNLKNVSSLYITLTYDATMFDLKSPAYSDLLNSAAIKGDVTRGEYVVAFSTPQNITDDLFTFQLEAKDNATVGAYSISCVVEVNGSVSNGTNVPEMTYNGSSELTIGNLLGDLDSDGDVDEDDAVYLLLYTFRASTHPMPEGQNVDYNNDGVVNSDDAIYLKNYLTNPAQNPLTGGA